jgi:hypothetical protein
MNGGVRARSCAAQPPSDRKTPCLENPRPKGGILTNGERRFSILNSIPINHFLFSIPGGPPQGRTGQVQNCEWLLPTRKGGMPSRGVPPSKYPGRILRPLRSFFVTKCFGHAVRELHAPQELHALQDTEAMGGLQVASISGVRKPPQNPGLRIRINIDPFLSSFLR